MSEQKKAVKIAVPSKDPKQDKNDKEKVKIGKDENIGPVEESEEDRLLREKLETNAKRIIESKKLNVKTLEKSINILSNEIKSATGSMTSVPKPLKFLRQFYTDLKSCYEKSKPQLSQKLQTSFADMMSVLAMTMSEENSREMLKYKLEGDRNALGEWGHEFVRALCGEISQEYALEEVTTKMKQDLKQLSHQIVPFLIEQNTETEAVDLLFEVEELKFILENKYIDESNYERTCLYLLKFSEYLFNLEEVKMILETTYALYISNNDLPHALRIALMMNEKSKMEDVFKKATDREMKIQLAYIMGSQKAFCLETEDEEIDSIMFNADLSANFKNLAQNLNMETPKSTEDVYKSYLYDENANPQNTQSAQVNLAATYVNGLVNCGFGQDSLLAKKDAEFKPSNDNWVTYNQNKGKTAALGTLGLVKMWDTESGVVDLLNDYLDPEQKNTHCTAGALLGMGLVGCGVKEADNMAGILIADFFSDSEDERTSDSFVKISACLGMAFTYAGNPSETGDEFLKTILENDDEITMVKSFAALALGMIYVGSGNTDIAGAIAEAISNLDETDTNQTTSRFMILGWAMIYLGRQNLEDENQRMHLEDVQKSAIVILENTPFAELAFTMLDVCAYTGSGNVIQVQKLLQLCAQHLTEDGLTMEETQKLNEEEKMEEKEDEEEKIDETAKEEEEKPIDKEKAAKNAARQSMAVLGVALITFGDPVGKQMAERTFQHLLQYGELAIRRAVPLAMALLRISDPDYGQIEILSKLSHDSDKGIAMSAIFALGMMCAGTTNSRVAHLLRQRAVFYKKEKEILLCVRLAQGLLFAGKGLVTLHPFHSDRTLLSPTAVAGILTVMTAAIDMKETLLDADKFHILIFALAAAIRPRMMMTLTKGDDGKLEPVKVKVRVGQAVEIVGQAGNPKTITGFQTQESPVLLNVGDRAELATDEYESYSSVLEGVVVLKKVDKMEEKTD